MVVQHTTYNFDSFIKCTIFFHRVRSQFCAAVNVVYFQLFSSPQEQNVNHEKSLPILCPPPPLPLAIHSSTSCIYGFSSGQFSSVAQLCPTLWDGMKCSTSGHPVHRQLPEFTQTHVYWVRDAIQPSHPLSSPFPPAFNLSQHQALFKWVSSLHQVAKVLEFQLQRQSFQWIFRTHFLKNGLVGSPCSTKDTLEFSPTPRLKCISFLPLSFLYSPTLTSIRDYWKNLWGRFIC